MRKNKNKWVNVFIIGTFISLYLIVSIISTIHVIDFFRLSNPEWLAISLAIAFEIGAAASLASLIVLERMNKFLIWTLFIVLTLFQAMGNTYYSFIHLENFSSWIELFNLMDEEVIHQKRILSIISGGILPFIALGFIKSLVDYIKPDKDNKEKIKENTNDKKIINVIKDDNIELINNQILDDQKIQQGPKDKEIIDGQEIDVIENLDGGDSSIKDDYKVDNKEMNDSGQHQIKERIITRRRYPENLE